MKKCVKCRKFKELVVDERWKQYQEWCCKCAVEFENGCSSCKANPPWSPLEAWIDNEKVLCVYCHPQGIYYRPNPNTTELLSQPDAGDEGFLDMPDWR